MTQTEDRSYYEISLTNGQVLVAFGVLLACVFGAFVSGMWVAREALDEVSARPPAATPAIEGEPTDAIEFFGGDGEPGGEAATPSTTAAAPSGDEPPAPRIQQVKPLPPSSSPDPAVGRVADRGAESRSHEGVRPTPATPADEEGSRAEPDPPVVASVDTDRREAIDTDLRESVDTDRREPVPSAATPAPATEGTGGFVIQVFSSSDEAQAEALVQRLRGGGYRAFEASETVNGRAVYRVRVGPYPDRTGAEREAEKLKREFKLETWVTAG